MKIHEVTVSRIAAYVVVILTLICSIVFSVPAYSAESTRAVIPLDGMWRFMPAEGGTAVEPKGGWALLEVPGTWTSSGWRMANLKQEDIPTGQPWDDLSLDELNRGWYERDILIPKEWSGRAILLNLSRVSTDARVFVNSTPCGSVLWPGGRVDVTEAVKPGVKNTIRLKVIASYNAATAAKALLDPAYPIKGNEKLETKGLIGSVNIESRPRGAHISGLFIRTSVARKELAVDVDLEELDPEQEGKPLDIKATVSDKRGNTVKTFMASGSTLKGSGQTLTFSWPWENPKLWDYKHPNLYDLHVEVVGAGFADKFTQDFGFREFTLVGKEFLLNGLPFRLRPGVLSDSYSNIRDDSLIRLLDGYLKAGFNMVEVWPWNHYERGIPHFQERYASYADGKGLPLMYPFLALDSFNPTDAGFKSWEKAMVSEWKGIRNHPSICILVGSPNRWGPGDDMNPLKVGNRANLMASGDKQYVRNTGVGLRYVSIMKEHDPSRPVTTHQGGAVGDFQTTNTYMNMLPLQEREEWLSEWAKSGDMAYMAVEFGMPLAVYTFLRGRAYEGIGESEPWMTEFCAEYLGSEAYRLETPEYRDAISSKFVNGQSYTSWHGSTLINDSTMTQRLTALFTRNTWRSWRTWGLTGGMVPWDFGSPWESKGRVDRQALVESNGPTLAWIAGSKDNFTEKDHNYYSGARIEKQVVLINDERSSLDYTFWWKAIFGGKVIAGDIVEGSIGVGQNAFNGITLMAPGVTAKTKGTIIMTAKMGRTVHRDAFGITLFPRVDKVSDIRPVSVYDPQGDTLRYFKGLGIPTEEIAVGEIPASPGKTLILGRHALDAGDAPIPDIRKFAEAGGKVMIMGQSPEWYRTKLGLRVARAVSRRFFPVPSMIKHPVIAGIDAEDLSDWRGSGSLIPETAGLNLEQSQHPTYGWHWGNTGSVSGAAMEKPHKSGWTPLLEGEFDLAYTPLMELRVGKGLLICCTLDLEGRTGGPEPVAELLTCKLVRYMEAYVPQGDAPGQAVYVGGPDGRKILDDLGLSYRVEAALPTDPGLVVVGPGSKLTDAAVKSFMASGGRLFFLPSNTGKPGLGLTTEPLYTSGAFDVPSWPEFKGISMSDLHFRSTVRLDAIQTPKAGIQARLAVEGAFARYAVGQGVSIFAQLMPGMLESGTYTYLRFSEWRLARTVSQILANMGGVFKEDYQTGLAGGMTKGDPYWPGFRTDFPLGDDPYRFWRW